MPGGKQVKGWRMEDEYENQSQLLYELVRRIAEKIESEVA